MARPLRIEYPGAFYHITSPGNERKAIFKSKQDRIRFLDYLGSATDRYGACVHVYCLMNNHYQLLMETPLGNLSQIMRHINGAYTTYFNVKRGRSGHLFQGRYKSILVEVDEYAKALSRYIHLNPVRANMVSVPEDFQWSSYNQYIGKQKARKWLVRDFILNYFGTKYKTAQRQYYNYVNQLVGQEYKNPLDEVAGAVLLGSQDFIKFIKVKRFFYLIMGMNFFSLIKDPNMRRRIIILGSVILSVSVLLAIVGYSSLKTYALNYIKIYFTFIERIANRLLQLTGSEMSIHGHEVFLGTGSESAPKE